MRRIRQSFDVLVPASVAVLVAFTVVATSSSTAAITVPTALVALASGVALWWRRRNPVLVMGIALAGGLVVQLVAPMTVFALAALVAMGSLAAARPPMFSLPALALLLA